MGNLESRGEVEGFNMSLLQIDQAYVQMKNKLGRPVSVFKENSNCVKCTPESLGSVINSEVFQVSTKYDSVFYVTDYSAQLDKENSLCWIKESLGEFGVYNVNISSKENCSFETLKDPVNIYIPLLLAVICLVAIQLIWLLTCKIYRYYKNKKIKTESEQHLEGIQTIPYQSTETIQQSKAEVSPQPQKQRLKSLDTFRGISIVIMIFVNFGGGKYYFFDHATWDGLQVADLVFPWFLWIMGLCIPMSIRSSLKRTTKKQTFLRIAKRAAWLFLIGLILGSGTNITTLRVLGVLQRFAITYFVLATICMLFSSWFEKEFKISSAIHDILRLCPHWVTIICILILHCIIIFVVEVPGCPRGYLGPGGLHMNMEFYNCTGGVTGYVDRLILGKHVYGRSEYTGVYGTKLPFDPEGIVSTLTAIVQVFLGIQAGSTLLTYKSTKDRLLRWITWGVITGILAAILCKGSMSDGWIPVNKNLWSLSFVLVTTSFAFLLLSICYVAIDVYGIWSGSPFYYPGMNSILVYCGHQLAYNLFPFVWNSGNLPTHAEALAMNLWTTALWVVISVWLYHIKFFLAL